MGLLAIHAKRFPMLLPESLDETGLSRPDAALAHAIVDQTIRRWITLAFLLETRLKKPLKNHDPTIQAALLAGASQLFFFDRLPAYAVLNETVEWIKARRGPKSGGLVNAVLRRLLDLIQVKDDAPVRTEQWSMARDELPLGSGGAIALRHEILPEDPLDRLAIATGMPRSLLFSLRVDHDAKAVEKFALHGLVKPPTILNTAGARDPAPTEHLTPHDLPGLHVFTGASSDLTTLLDARPDIWAQDPTSAAAVQIAAGLSPKLVVDVCAGQGAKTRQLRAMFPDARMVATDLADDRRNTLERIFENDDSVTVTTLDGLLEHTGQADLVLLDVPCSNTGVLGRRVEARCRWSGKSIGSLVDVQRQIIADSIRLLAPDGAILYATCSVDRRENEEQIAWTEKWHHLTRQKCEHRWPRGGPGAAPQESNDGGFAGLLR